MGLYNPPQAPTINIPASYTPTIEGVQTNSVSVTTSYSVLVTARANRTGLTIWNQGTNRVIVTYGDATTTENQNDSGAFYLDGGGIFIDDYPAYQGIYSAKTTTGTSLLSVKELTDSNFPS
ncbi:hypothetical protein NIES2101_23935 [Calothrix sp. HK-06]|nr:hypothetical protein NIES2101_23800 [Calothrix sp. HK-06]OKH47318.1 hypothetical protein NIES2101_23935 [Calothrix sp. HK-06]